MPKPQWFQVGKAENGKRLQVPVGQYVLVRLLGNPTTGYQWQTAGVTGRSLQSLAADPQYVPAPSKPGMVGSGGTYNFKFHAERPGTTTIKLVYVRPWEKNRPAVDTFMCTIDVFAPRPAAPATGNAPAATGAGAGGGRIW
jgi:inhibitor of cysteine peptidase